MTYTFKMNFISRPPPPEVIEWLDSGTTLMRNIMRARMKLDPPIPGMISEIKVKKIFGNFNWKCRGQSSASVNNILDPNCLLM